MRSPPLPWSALGLILCLLSGAAAQEPRRDQERAADVAHE